jgi:crotonobetainyl-CoA:carnitine CoA-transferase CaiB-like acyl-CoA transferase
VVNRNKRSLAINLRAPRARDIVMQLAKRSDVLVEGFRPGVMARLGLGYDELRAVNPKIIYCAITGYGQDGPLVELGGHDINYQSYAGILVDSVAPDGKNYAYFAFPVKMSDYQFSVNRQPPALGQHNAEVLAELGCPDAEIT